MKKLGKSLLIHILLVFTMGGCIQTQLEQGIFSTAAEQVTGLILENNPTELPALQKIATALPTAFTQGLSSYQIGQVIGGLNLKAGGLATTASRLIYSLDGAVRNFISQNGSGPGADMSLTGAIAQQQIQVYAHAMQSAIQVYEGEHGLPSTP